MIGSNFGVDLGNDTNELFIADDSISILISEVDHLVNFSTGEVLSDASSHLLELFRAEVSLSAEIEGFEHSLNGGLTVRFTAESKDSEEGTEVNVTSMTSAVDDGEDLACLGFQIESTDGIDQLFSGHVSTAVVIKDVEDFLQLGDSVSIKAFLDVF